MASRPAFTLIELMVVMVIIGVLMGMVVPQMVGSLGATRLREESRQLLLMARYAQGYALGHGCTCRLALDPSSRQYVLSWEEDPEGKPGEFTPVPGEFGRLRTLEPGVSFGRVRVSGSRGMEAEQNTITFGPSGQVDASVVEITDGRRTWSLVLVPSTGRAKLVDGIVTDLPDDRRDLDA